MSIKKLIIDQIIHIEGGYVDNPSDSGGRTKYGITEATAREWGYTGDIRDLPHQTAFDIYENRYWSSLRADEIENLSPLIADEIVDTGVNMGINRAGKFLQRALNVFNNQGALYPDLEVDGRVGSKTVETLRLYLNVRNENVLLKALNSLQGAFYVELSERREKDETFIYGWFKNRVKI